MATGSGMAATISSRAAAGRYAAPMSAEHCSWCGEACRPTTASAPSSRPASGAPSSAASSTSCRGRSAAPTGRRRRSTPASCATGWSRTARSAARALDGHARAARPPPRRAPDRRRVLRRPAPGGLGEGRRALGLSRRSGRRDGAGAASSGAAKPTAIPSAPTAAAARNASRQPIDATMPPDAALPAATPPTSDVSGHV